MSRAARRAINAILACLLLAWPVAAVAQAEAEAEASNTIVFAGLRPASGDDYSTADIRRLSEAQRVRGMLEEITRELTGRTVLNHAVLRAALGSAYLVDFVDCGGDVKCVTGNLAKLRSRSALAVFGDYSADRSRYNVRMRIVDIRSAQLLAEVEFSLPAKKLEDRERWKRELSSMFNAVEGMVTTGQDQTGDGGDTSGDGGDTSGGSDQGTETGPDTGDTTSEGSGADASGGDAEGGSGRDTDELTDADFGVEVASPTAPLAVARRTDPPMIEVSGGFALLQRRFRYQSEPGVEMTRPDGFLSDWTSRVAGGAAIYPLDRLGVGRLAGLGIVGGFGRTLSSGTARSSVRDTRLYVGLAYRIAIGPSASYPTFQLHGGYLREDAVVLDSSVELPDTSYRGAALGGEIHMPIGSPHLAVNAALRYLLIGEAGEIVEPTYYGRSKVAGLDLEASIELRPIEAVYLRIGGAFTRFDFELGENGERSSLGAIGAQDRFIAATIATGLLL